MVKGWRVIVLLGVVSAMTAGCIPTQRDLRMERDLEEMKRRLASFERNAALQRQAAPGERRLDEVGRQVADLQAAVDTLRVDVQAVSGRLEDINRQREESREEMALIRDDLSLKISSLEDSLTGLTTRELSSAGSPGASSPEALYEEGLTLIRQRGNFVEGRKRMSDFVQDHAAHPLAVNAMYWIGEAYYGEKKYENAILQFQDVIQKYPGNPKAPAAMLKQGLAFHALGDVKNAKVIMQKVMETYPKSTEAEKARERLAAW